MTVLINSDMTSSKLFLLTQAHPATSNFFKIDAQGSVLLETIQFNLNRILDIVLLNHHILSTLKIQYDLSCKYYTFLMEKGYDHSRGNLIHVDT